MGFNNQMCSCAHISNNLLRKEAENVTPECPSAEITGGKERSPAAEKNDEHQQPSKVRPRRSPPDEVRLGDDGNHWYVLGSRVHGQPTSGEDSSWGIRPSQ